MKVLDRYLVRELLIPIVYCCISLIFLILIADLFNNLDDLLHHKTPALSVAVYYASLVPYAFVQTISWAAWLGTLFLLVNLGFHNETIAMKAAGLQITTIVRPVLFLGFLIGIMTFLIGDRVVPKTLRLSSELHETQISSKHDPKKNMRDFQNVTYFSGNDQLYFFKYFSPKKAEVQGIVALWLGEKDSPTRQTMVAQRGYWKEGQWVFEGVTEHQMDSRGRILGEPKTFPIKTYPEIRFTPAELAISSTDSTFLNYRELTKLIDKLDENGVSVSAERVDLNYRLASPWQGLVMMLIAVPFLAKTTSRKVIAGKVLLCVGFIFAYQVTCAVGVALGKAGKLFPFASAWFGNIVFGLGSLFYLEKANY